LLSGAARRFARGGSPLDTLPKQARYQLRHTSIYIFYSEKIALLALLRCPKSVAAAIAATDFDRGAFSCSLHPPQAAVALKAQTKRSTR